MSSTMANEDKMSPNSKFNNEDDLNISNMQPLGRIGFVTTQNKMKKSYQRGVLKQSWWEYRNLSPTIITTCTILKQN